MLGLEGSERSPDEASILRTEQMPENLVLKSHRDNELKKRRLEIKGFIPNSSFPSISP